MEDRKVVLYIGTVLFCWISICKVIGLYDKMNKNKDSFFREIGGSTLYEYILGKITFVSPYYIVCETAGIGYRILVANPFRYSGKFGENVLIYLYQVVREDAQQLYGFSSIEEKQLFEKLISVSGIGPKSALAIMALEDHGGLVHAIESEDAPYLVKFPGVGKKTAQQMILDLKGKLDDLTATPEVVVAMQETKQASVDGNQALDEALAALNALGYSEREIKKIIKELRELEVRDTDSYLRHALKLLMKK